GFTNRLAGHRSRRPAPEKNRLDRMIGLADLLGLGKMAHRRVLFQVPADSEPPVIFGLVALRPLFRDGKFSRAFVVGFIGAGVTVDVVELDLETALLAGLNL